MRFISRNRGALYNITHGTRDYVGPDRRPDTKRGIWVEFDEGQFDTAVAQKKKGWTDEQRELVEEHLRSHPDFGVSMFVPEELGEQSKVGTCSFGVPTAEGFELCGDEATDGPYCAGHAEQIRSALAKEEKPKAEKVKAGAK